MWDNILQGIGIGIGFGLIYATAMIIVYIITYYQSKKNQDALMKYMRDLKKTDQYKNEQIIPRKNSTDDSNKFHL